MWILSLSNDLYSCCSFKLSIISVHSWKYWSSPSGFPLLTYSWKETQITKGFPAQFSIFYNKDTMIKCLTTDIRYMGGFVLLYNSTLLSRTDPQYQLAPTANHCFYSIRLLFCGRMVYSNRTSWPTAWNVQKYETCAILRDGFILFRFL